MGEGVIYAVMSSQEEVIHLSEQVGRSLTVDARCEGIITYSDAGDEKIRLWSPDKCPSIIAGDYVAVYRVGEGYVIGEFTANDTAQFLALEKNTLLEYFERAFRGYQWITQSYTENAWWAPKLCCV